MCFRKLSNFGQYLMMHLIKWNQSCMMLKYIHINVANYGELRYYLLPHLLLQYLFYYILERKSVKEMKVKLFIKPARLVNISLAGLKYLIVSLNAVTRPQ